MDTEALLRVISGQNHAIFDRMMDVGASSLELRGKKTTLELAANAGSDYMLEKLLAIPQMHEVVNDAGPSHLTPLQVMMVVMVVMVEAMIIL